MKNIVACILVLMLIILLFACQAASGQPEETSSVSRPTLFSTAIPNASLPTVALLEYPVIDGSSSTVNMHGAIRARLTDTYVQPHHSQTYEALNRLLPGSENPADVVLAVKYYDRTLAAAKEKGADLVITPIAKEGFVFIVNKDNPVDSLTQQQIRDIYSGEITNWKELGGNDKLFKLYIRNEDSGSQTAMEDFLSGANFAEEAEPVYSMYDMLNVIGGVYDKSSDNIGYNIFSWAMEQDIANRPVKMLAVDGVMPSNETLADNSYPLIVYTYSYYNKGNTKGKALTDWLLTEEGQELIASAGYVGIDGAVSKGEPIDYGRDVSLSREKAREFYEQNLWKYSSCYIDEDASMDEWLNHPQLDELSNGKQKHFTVLWLCYCGTYSNRVRDRFIVLTRERGGEFEVINEGELLNFKHYDDTVYTQITPGDTENHSPPPD